MTASQLPDIASEDLGARPRQAARARRHLPGALTLACACAAVACAVAGAAGIWFAPFITGVVIGAVSTRRPAAPAFSSATLAAAIGWVLPLLWDYSHGEPIVATARVVAALAGLPAVPEITFLAGVLVAAIQSATGCALGRVLAASLRAHG